jgi:MYXO-CTERM domain-containing protein
VTATAAAASGGSHGGGAFDWVTLLGLAGLSMAGVRRRQV